MIDIRDFGGTLTGDNAPALNAAVAHCWANDEREIFFPKGQWGFDTGPDPITFGVRLVGLNPSESVLIRKYSGDFIKFTGSQGFGGGISNVMLHANPGTTGGKALWLRPGNTVFGSDYMWFENIVITGGGTWYAPLAIEGDLRQNPRGVRDLHFKNIHLFAAEVASALLMNVVGAVFSGLNTYLAGGQKANVYIGGGSTVVHISGFVGGELNLSGCEKVVFSGTMGSLSTDSSAKDCHLSGICMGGVANHLTSSIVSLV